MPERNPVKLTSQKFKQLKDELDELVNVGRKVIADKLESYRTDDRSEDYSAYSDVLEEKEWMERRINELEDMLENAEIADVSCDLEKVSLGCEVRVDRDGKEMKFVIVPSLEADPAKGRISEVSPMGKALLGKKVGEKVVIDAPEVRCNCKVLGISASNGDKK